MLSLFRNNQFTTVFFLALYVGLLHTAPALGLTPEPSSLPVSSGVLFEAWLGRIAANPLFNPLAAAVLVFIQAIVVNALVDEFRMLGERNWLPGMFYVLVSACLPDFLFLTPPLVAATFLPVAMRRIFKTYKQPAATTLIFDAGFWTMVAALFYPPAIFMLLAVYAGIHVMRAFKLKEQIVMLSGVITPIFLAWLWYFWTDRGGAFWGVQFGDLFHWHHFDLSIDLRTVLESIVIGLLFLIILLSYGTYSFRKLNQIQKYVGILYWFLFIAGLSALFQREAPPAHLLLLVPSMGIFLSMTFSAMKNALVAELCHLALLGYIPFIQFASAHLTLAG